MEVVSLCVSTAAARNRVRDRVLSKLGILDIWLLRGYPIPDPPGAALSLAGGLCPS